MVLVIIMAAQGVIGLFTLWMLVDCARKGQGFYWFAIIICFPVMGPLAYFITEKSVDPDFSWLTNLFRRGPSVDELRYRLRQTPCVANRLRLAEALFDKRELKESIDLFGEALKSDASCKDAAYGLALALAETGEYTAAAAHLSAIIEKDRGYRDYEAIRSLAEILWAAGQREDSVAMARELVGRRPNLRNQVTLAECLIEMNQAGETRTMLTRALEDHRYAPAHERRRYRKWASRAEKLLEKI